MANTTKIAAVAIVALLVVGGVAAFLFLGDDGEGEKNTMGRLQVYGNVDNDDHIDSDDLKAFDAMTESWDSDANPYADANRDGTLDSEDKAIIQKLINKEPCTVYYINGLGDVAKADYPIKRIGIAGTMVHPVINALDAGNLAFGKTGSSSNLDPVLDAPTYDLPQIGPKAYTIDKEEVSKYNFDAIVTLYSSTYDDVETDLEGMPIDCIRINPESSDLSLNTYLLMGFLLDRTERADAIVAFYDKYNEILAQKVSALRSQKTSLTMYSYGMCATDYYMTKNTVAAGTINLSDFTAEENGGKNTRSLKDDNGAWAAVEKYQADYIIQYTGWGVRWDTSTDLSDEFTYYGKYFEKMEAYPENYIVINKTMPDIARSAFVAGLIYDQIGLDFAYDLYEELIETFYPYIEDYDAETAACFITYDMVKDQL